MAGSDRIEAARAALGSIQARLVPGWVRELLAGLLDELGHLRELVADANQAAHAAAAVAVAVVQEHEERHHTSGRMDGGDHGA